MPDNPIIEIVHERSGAIVVCDRLNHCLSCDDGLREEAADIRAALARGQIYKVGGGAAEGFVIRSKQGDA